MGNVTKRLRLHSLAFLLLAGVCSAAELEPKTIRDFTPGLHTRQDSSVIPDGASQDLSNVDVFNGRIDKRRGTSLVNSTNLTGDQAVRKGHEYISTSGTFFLLTVSSNTIFQSSNGGVTNTVGTSAMGITATTRFQTVNALGNAYFISPTTSAIVFDGSTFAQNTAIPLGNAAAFFAGRLWVANGSNLYGSRVNSDSDWTDSGLVDEDAFTAIIRKDNGYSITALVPFGSDLFIFKSYSIDRLVINTDGVTFSLVPVVSHIGTNFPEAVQAADNALVWLAHDGVYGYNGSQLTRISENIQPTIANLAQLASASRSYSESTGPEFALGTSTGVSTAVTDGSVVLSTWTATDTTAADFILGTLNSVTTNTVSGALYLSTNNVNIENYSFEDGSGTDADFWEESGGGADRTSAYAQSGSRSLDLATDLTGDVQYKVALLDGNSVFISTISTVATSSLAGDVWVQRTLQLAAFAGRTVRLRFDTNGESTNGTIISSSFTVNGNAMTYYVLDLTRGASGHQVFLDTIEDGRTTISSGTFVSQAFDSSFTTPKWLPSTPTYSDNGQNIEFYTQVSDDNVTFDSTVTWTAGSVPTSADKRYIRYKIVLSTSAAATGIPFVSDITLAARNTSGRYVSQAIDLSGASSWLPFTANGDSDGGSLTYEIYTDTDTVLSFSNGNVVAASFISSQTITSGNTPTISTNTYAHVGSTFSITAGTQDPQLDDFTLAWGEGNATLYPASLFWDQAYYLSLAVNSAVYNDTIFIFDRNDAWTKYDGLSAFTMFKYRTAPYFGSALAGDIVKMQVQNRYRDYTDAAIESYWVSKDFDLGYPITVKTLLRYYITGQRLTGGNITFSYGVDRGSLVASTYSLTLTNGFFRKTVVPNSLVYTEGVQHRFKFYDNTLDGPVSILSLTGRWNVLTNP